MPPLSIHIRPSLPGLTLALGAGSIGLEACGADALEATFRVLTPAIGAGRGTTGTLIHIWDQDLLSPKATDRLTHPGLPNACFCFDLSRLSCWPAASH